MGKGILIGGATQAVCRECYSSQAVLQCARCKMALYCGKKCQKLDWETHQTFCKPSENSDLAIERRNKCLKIITDEALFRYMVIDCFLRIEGYEGFLAVVRDKAGYYPLISYEELIKQKFPLTESTYSELEEEMSKETTSVYKKRGIVTVYITENQCYIYTLGSDKISTTWKAIDNMPKELLCFIIKMGGGEGS